MTRMYLYDVATRTDHAGHDRSLRQLQPGVDADGKWLYFLSNRNFVSVVGSPWGSRQPEPFFDKQTKIYHVSLKPGERSPFQPDDELYAPPSKRNRRSTSPRRKKRRQRRRQDEARTSRSRRESHRHRDPPARSAAAGRELRRPCRPTVNGSTSCRREVSTPGADAEDTARSRTRVRQPETFMRGRGADTSCRSIGRSSWCARRRTSSCSTSRRRRRADTSKNKVPLGDWTFRLDPRDEWRQMFTEAWRLRARLLLRPRHARRSTGRPMHAKYLPLVDRVTDRVGAERHPRADGRRTVGAAHLRPRRRAASGRPTRSSRARSVRRSRATTRPAASASSTSTAAIRTFRTSSSPLAQADVNVAEGDVIESVNGVPTLSARDLEVLLRNQAGKQVLLRRQAEGGWRVARRGRDADHAGARKRSPLRRVGVHAPARRRESKARERSATSTCARWAAPT